MVVEQIDLCSLSAPPRQAQVHARGNVCQTLIKGTRKDVL